MAPGETPLFMEPAGSESALKRPQFQHAAGMNHGRLQLSAAGALPLSARKDLPVLQHLVNECSEAEDAIAIRSNRHQLVRKYLSLDPSAPFGFVVKPGK